MKLGDSSNVSQGSLGLKIMGLYEKPVVDKINSIKKINDFVNFGAADGYMALGPLFNKSCKRAICFELTEKGRMSVKKNAIMNNINDDLIVKGEVNQNIISSLQELNFDPANSVILSDIEGAEFNVFTEEVFSFFRGATIIIELHDKLIKDGHDLREKLIKKIPNGANLEIISLKQSLSFENIKDLEDLHDIDRALVMTEGRKIYGEWLVVEY